MSIRGNSAVYSPCNTGRYHVTSLQGSVVYVFLVKATDSVGNEGPPRTYIWKVGKCSNNGISRFVLAVLSFCLIHP